MTKLKGTYYGNVNAPKAMRKCINENYYFVNRLW